MTAFLALLLIAAGWSLVLVAMNRHDGQGGLATQHCPPSSHVPDVFEQSRQM